MIRTVRIPRTVSRMGSTAESGCPWYNPYCWFVPDDDPTKCYGGGPRIDVAACIAAQADARALAKRDDPAGAQDYEDYATGDVIGVLNPFTGSGPLSSAGSGTFPAWAWMAGGGLVAALLMRSR